MLRVPSILPQKGGTRVPLVLPDGAILSEIGVVDDNGRSGLALAINAQQVRSMGFLEQWNTIVDKLRKFGPITLTSNEWTTDHPFWKKYLNMDGVHCEGQSLDYSDYARFLSGFEVVVSSRLHTCVLGLLAGAPIVPVETGTFKLTGFFNQIGMKNEPIRMDEGEWEQRLLDRIAAVLADPESRIIEQDSHIRKARSSLREGLNAAFDNKLLQPASETQHNST